jgi:hypothetical protein
MRHELWMTGWWCAVYQPAKACPRSPYAQLNDRDGGYYLRGQISGAYIDLIQRLLDKSADKAGLQEIRMGKYDSERGITPFVETQFQQMVARCRDRYSLSTTTLLCMLVYVWLQSFL